MEKVKLENRVTLRNKVNFLYDMSFYIIIALLITVIVVVFCNVGLVNRMNKLNSKLDNLTKIENSIILSQSRNDSLFMIHLSTCSFISNSRIKVGYDGYLQVKSPIDK